MNQLPRIAFIGAGNMARSLIGGLLQHGFTTDELLAADPDAVQRESLHARFGVRVSADNQSAAADAQMVVFAVRQPVLPATARALAATLVKNRPLVMSVAAGIREPALRCWLGYDAAIVRVIPNTPALIGEGTAVLYANPFVSEPQRAFAERVLKSVGLALWVDDERHMDAVNAVSACGPAYFFLMLEALEAAGCQLGLPTSLARALVLQTGYGTTRMARESAEPPAELRRRVASPGGTISAALDVLDGADLRDIFLRALTAARDRGVEMSRQFGKDEA